MVLCILSLLASSVKEAQSYTSQIMMSSDTSMLFTNGEIGSRIGLKRIFNSYL